MIVEHETISDLGPGTPTIDSPVKGTVTTSAVFERASTDDTGLCLNTARSSSETPSPPPGLDFDMEGDIPKSGNESPLSTVTSERASMMARDQAPETPKMAHDSLVTVRLSEPESLALDPTISSPASQTAQSTPTRDPARTASLATTTSTPIDVELVDSVVEDNESRASKSIAEAEESEAEAEDTKTPRDSAVAMPPPILTIRTLQDELLDDGHSSDDQEEVNWEELQKTEDEQHKDDETDNVGYGTS